MTDEQKIEAEIKAIKDNMRKKVDKVVEPNHSEFLMFMLTNYDYKHDFWKLNHDLSLRLKDEEDRAAYMNSESYD